MENLLTQISINIIKFGKLASELDNLNKSMNVTGSSNVKSDLLTRKERAIISMIEETTSKLDEIATYSLLDHTCKIRAEALKDDFQRILKRFQKTQIEMKRRLLAESRSSGPPVADLLGLNVGTSAEHSLPSGAPHAQVQSSESATVQDLGFAFQQEDEMHSIEEDIVNVNQIFEKLSSLVYEQRTAIDTIEDNIESAHSNQEQGTEQLMKSATNRQRRRKRCCICWVVIAVAVAVTVVILVLVYSPHSKD